MRIVFLVLVSVLSLLLPTFGFAENAADMEEARFARWIHGGLLDPDAPIEQRRAIVDEIEGITKDDSDPGLLYLLGSLYRQDPERSSSPLAQDLDHARKLLSRAALHGIVPAMAKLSTIELQAGNRFDAYVWAQFYYHYAKAQAQADPHWTTGFAASILHNALDGLSAADKESANESVVAMIQQYDTRIRQGLATLAESRFDDRFRDARPGKRVLMNAEDLNGRRLESGMAEYVMEFAADGSVGKLWTIDAWPNPRLAKILRNIALGYRVEPAVASDAAGRVMILPLSYEDGRFLVRDEASKD